MTHTDQQRSGEKQDVGQLNIILQSELAALRAYEECVAAIGHTQIRLQLYALQYSHRVRARLLRARIAELGGRPSRYIPGQGALSRVADDGASLSDQDQVLSLLRSGENQGMTEYQNAIDKLSPHQQQFVEVRLLPEQARITSSLAALKRTRAQTS